VKTSNIKTPKSCRAGFRWTMHAPSQTPPASHRHSEVTRLLHLLLPVEVAALPNPSHTKSAGGNSWNSYSTSNHEESRTVTFSDDIFLTLIIFVTVVPFHFFSNVVADECQCISYPALLSTLPPPVTTMITGVERIRVRKQGSPRGK
jgi:hypothetical protein